MVQLPPNLVAFLFSGHSKLERIGEAHLSYYASAYNRVSTNQPPQNLFISCAIAVHQFL